MKKESILKTAGVAEITLSYKPALSLIKQPKITTSLDAFNVFRDKWDSNQIEFVEEFKVMLLSRANNLIGIVSISKGSNCGTVVDPKMVFAAAISSNACNIMLAHNHPSGSLIPSKDDGEITMRIKEGAKLLDLRLLDHLIITKTAYFSFADEGIF